LGLLRVGQQSARRYRVQAMAGGGWPPTCYSRVGAELALLTLKKYAREGSCILGKNS